MIPLSGHTTLYRMFNDEGELLYVGISTRMGDRLSDHRADKPWYSLVTNMTLVHYETRAEAEAAELRAIRTECPVYNKAGVLVSAPITEEIKQDIYRLFNEGVRIRDIVQIVGHSHSSVVRTANAAGLNRGRIRKDRQ